VNLIQGSALFIFPELHFSGLQFDSSRKNTIGCMYQFDICNNFIDFENFVILNLCQKVGREKDRPQHMGFAIISKNQKYLS